MSFEIGRLKKCDRRIDRFAGHVIAGDTFAVTHHTIAEHATNDEVVRFGSRMRGEGPWADLFSKMFNLHKRRLGLSEYRAGLSTEYFTNGRMKQANLFE